MSNPAFLTSDPPQCGEQSSAAGIAVGTTQAGSAGSASSLQFNDGKAADAFRTIGEVAKALAIRPHVLRYWEEQFPMLRPVKRSGRRRYYRKEDVELVETIDRLVHREGYPLRGARQKLEGETRKSKRQPSRTGPIDQPPAADLEPHAPELLLIAASSDGNATLIEQLVTIRDGLAKALET